MAVDRNLAPLLVLRQAFAAGVRHPYFSHEGVDLVDSCPPTRFFREFSHEICTSGVHAAHGSKYPINEKSPGRTVIRMVFDVINCPRIQEKGQISGPPAAN
jgi:hypothetical protein